MKRREVLALLGGAAAAGLPLSARGQQPMPTIGFLRNTSAEGSAHLLAAFRSGLADAGYVEGRNVAIKFGWALGRYDLLPKLAAEMVKLPVTVLFAGGSGEALAAKAATSTIPIVFTGGSDPVEIGLVKSLNRPEGNLTGATMIAHALSTKRLELLRQLTPTAVLMGVLANPNNPNTKTELAAAQEAARALGLQIRVFNASNDAEFDAAFKGAAEHRAGGLVVVGDPFFTTQRGRLAALARQYKLPTIYSLREYAASGGLVSYGASFADAYRQCAVYVGRILKGEKPGDLPVVQPTKFDLVINLKTAKALGLTVPQVLLATADEVIE